MPVFSNVAMSSTLHVPMPALPWQHLRRAAKTPLLPFGLAGSILLALIPPLWRRIMDPKVAYWMAPPLSRFLDSAELRDG